MAKPRIIIADKDIDYIIPLQHKFIEEFFEKINLEIITDEQYFEECFSTPQSAEILVVSEELYDPALLRHNIANVFLMKEQREEEQTAELNVNRIFKYTSIKEIFNEIVGKSAGALQIKSNDRHETQVLMFYSASGGTGKTTLAMGVSASLTKNYKKVLYLNADRLQSFQHMLKNPAPVSAPDVYTKLSAAEDTVYDDIKHVIRQEIFNYLPPFKASLLSLGLEYALYEKIILSAKASGEYDFIVVDADTTFDEEKADILNIADKVVIVTNQTLSAVSATNILISNINIVNSDKYIFICNNFDKESENALISPNIILKFTVNDYVEHFRFYEKMGIDELSAESSIQKIAFLMI